MQQCPLVAAIGRSTLLLCATTLLLAAKETDSACEISRYLREAKSICQRDNGTLSGVSLCGPILLVEPATRNVFASERDLQNQLQHTGDLFTGKVPATVNIANTATNWAGVKWTMIMLPLPSDPVRRAALVAHEMWHRVQDQLGFASSGAPNSHLDTRDGRYWLQLEWRALAAALEERGAAKLRAIQDAEVFRARRHQIFPGSAEEEASMEFHEGLAEYTGVRLSGAADPARFVVQTELKEAPEKSTFVRSFAYATGPAYSLLLDQAAPEWRNKLSTRDDLALLLLNASQLSLPSDLRIAAKERAREYGGEALAKAEEEREQRRGEEERDYRARLVEGPTLVIPLRNMNMEFDPQTLVPLKPAGMVYPAIRVIDEWGILDVKTGGALMSPDFGKITIPAPGQVTVAGAEGNGWTLQLKEHWRVAPSNQPGSYTIRQCAETQPQSLAP